MDAGARRLRLAAFVLLGLGVAVYLAFFIGEVMDGDVSGIQHFPPAVLLAGLMWLAWRRSLAAGIVLLSLAVPLGVVYITLLIIRDLPPTWGPAVVLPPLVTGVLLVQAGRREHRSH
jgi:hypothetical protein